MGPAADLSLAGWSETLETNLTASFLGAKYQIPAMLERGGGSLIFNSTFVCYTAGLPGMAAYAASKAGLIGLTQEDCMGHGHTFAGQKLHGTQTIDRTNDGDRFD